MSMTRSPGQIALALAIALFLGVFLLVPVATVVYVAFTEKGGGGLTLVNFLDFGRTDLFVRSFWNSVYVSAMTVVWASALALPLAYLTTRFEFRGAMLVQTLGFLPLIMPPFVGAVAMQLLFGRNGTVNLLLDEWFDFKIGFMEGLNGVIFLQAIHYFPFILVNLSAALRNIDRSMEEAAQNLGSHGLRLFRRIALPLALPGYIAGASLVFVKVFDDVATPLLLNVKEMLAPQAYLRITSIGIDDPMGYVISVVLIGVAVATMWATALVMKGKDYATTQRGGGGLARRQLKPREQALAYAVVIGILAAGAGAACRAGAAVLRHGLVVQPAARRLHAGPLCPRAGRQLGLHQEHAALCRPCRRHRRGDRRRHRLSGAAHPPARPAVAGLGRQHGTRRARRGAGHRLSARLLRREAARRHAARRALDRDRAGDRHPPPALCAAGRLCRPAADLGVARGGGGEPRRHQGTHGAPYRVPLMTGGLLAGFVTSFATAAVELSAVLILVQSNSDAPLAYGLYVLMQTPAGRGAGAALGVIAVIIVAVCMWLSQLAVDRSQRARGLDQ